MEVFQGVLFFALAVTVQVVSNMNILSYLVHRHEGKIIHRKKDGLACYVKGKREKFFFNDDICLCDKCNEQYIERIEELMRKRDYVL